MNKITNTRVGDDIHFYVNGVESRGLVVKMNNAYITVFKEDGDLEDIHINETFFVKDIILNKTWDHMDDNERYDALIKAHAPSPRYITKQWDQIPVDLQNLLTKNNSSNVSEKDGKDDDMNTTVRIFDKKFCSNCGVSDEKVAEDQMISMGGGCPNCGHGSAYNTDKPKNTQENKASSGDTNTLEESDDDQATANAMVTGGKTRSGGFKLNTPIGTEGMTEHGGFGHTQMTRQHGIRERPLSTEERPKESKGTELTESETAANTKRLAGSNVKLFSGYDDKGEKIDKAWVSWLADRIDFLNKVHGLHDQKDQKSDFQWHKADSSNLLRTDQAERTSEGKVSGVSDHNQKYTGESGGVFGKRESEAHGQERVGRADTIANADGRRAPKGGKSPSDLEKAIEKLNQMKSNVENATHGAVAGTPNAGVNTNTNFDAPKDYEGASHSGIRPEQFKHENKKPSIKKEKLALGDTKPSDTHGGSNKYDTKQQGKNIKGRIVDQSRDRKT